MGRSGGSFLVPLVLVATAMASGGNTDPRVREFVVPTPDNVPGGIAAGPDGNLWFTAHGGMRWGASRRPA
jgi:streptogramin lyase